MVLLLICVGLLAGYSELITPVWWSSLMTTGFFLSYKSYKPTLLKSCHGNSRRLPWKRAGCSFPAHSSWACTLPFPLLTTHEQKLLFRAAGEKCITINIFILKTVYFLAFQLIPYGEWASWPSVAVPHLTTGAAEAVPGKIGSHVVQWSRL